MSKNIKMSAVYFICADDEFVAETRAKELFAELCEGVADDMSREIIQGAASNAGEAVGVCAAALEAAQTMPMFGGKKVVWLRGLNFLNDSNGRSADAQAALENLASAALKLNPEEVSLLISAANVDKRKKAFKIFRENSNFENYESSNAREACLELLAGKAPSLGVKIDAEAAEILVSTVAANTRMALQELEKLAAYVGFSGSIRAEDVLNLVPIFGEGDFFELAALFYSGDIPRSMAAIRRYFFTNKNASARPIIAALQKQNSLLIQIRALMDDGKLPKSARGVPKAVFEALAEKYLPVFKSDAKSSYNVFTQNPWYVGSKLAPIAAKFSLKKLLDIQLNLARAFEDLLGSAGGGDEAVIKKLFILGD